MVHAKNVIELSQVGYSKKPLLAIVPVLDEYGQSEYITDTIVEPVYRKIARTYVEHVHLQLFTENDERIPFDDNSAEVRITLHFTPQLPKYQNPTETVLYLNSDVKRNVFPENVPYRFTNRLNGPMDLSQGNWQLAMSMINFEKMWFYLNSEVKMQIYVTYNQSQRFKVTRITFPPGKYRCPNDVLEVFNGAGEDMDLRMIYSESARRFQIYQVPGGFEELYHVTSQRTVKLFVSHYNTHPGFFDMLGLTYSQMAEHFDLINPPIDGLAFSKNFTYPGTRTPNLVMELPPDFSKFVYNMYVNLENIIGFTNVADVEMRLLRTVPLKQSVKNDMQTKRFEDKRWLPIKVTTLYSITVSLTDDEGLF